MQWNEKVFSTTLGCGRSSVELRNKTSAGLKVILQTSREGEAVFYTLFTAAVGRSTDDIVGPWKEHFEDLLEVWGVDLPVTELKSLTYWATPGALPLCNCLRFTPEAFGCCRPTLAGTALQHYMCLSFRTGRRGWWLPYLRRVCAPTVGGKKKRKTLSHFSAKQGKSMPECVLIQVLYEQSFILSAVSQTHLRRVVDVLFIVFNGQNI